MSRNHFHQGFSAEPPCALFVYDTCSGSVCDEARFTTKLPPSTDYNDYHGPECCVGEMLKSTYPKRGCTKNQTIYCDPNYVDPPSESKSTSGAAPVAAVTSLSLAITAFLFV